MPVKIIDTDNQPLGALNVSFAVPPDPDGSRIMLKDLNEGFYDFSITYFTNPDRGSGYSKNLTLKYSDFKSLIDNITNSANPIHIDQSLLMLKFIHRFDTALMKWYLTLAFCERQAQIPDPVGRRVFPITEKGQRYDLISGATPSASTFVDPYDADYFDNLCYFDGKHYLLLDTNENVKHVVFPWQSEILLMVTDNYPYGFPAGKEMYIVFSSCSFKCDPTTPNPFSAVEWPHGLVIYLNESGKDILDNDSSIVTFRNRGADYSTMCPPNSNCPYYIYPPDLATVADSDFELEAKLPN